VVTASDVGPQGIEDLTPVCAIGASAGGIKALQRLFGAIEDDLGIAYVVIVHLAPDYPSQLAEI
jgi:two-component system CheB/CheR fusion protein